MHRRGALLVGGLGGCGVACSRNQPAPRPHAGLSGVASARCHKGSVEAASGGKVQGICTWTLFPNLSSALRRLNHVGPLGGFEPCVTWVANDSRLTGLSAESTACGPLLASGRAGSCPSQLGKDTNLLHPVFQVFPCRCLITSPSKLGL